MKPLLQRARRATLVASLAAGLWAIGCLPAQAQSYPSRALKIIVPAPRAGPSTPWPGWWGTSWPWPWASP